MQEIGHTPSTKKSPFFNKSPLQHEKASSHGYSLVACDIKTGRTHQIRVHMLHLGHPLVSDDKYVTTEQLAEDRSWCPRLFLHNYRLSFRDIRQKQVSVICPLAEDLRTALGRLGACEPLRGDEQVESDVLFGETSWQREVLRPSSLQWRPGTRLQRTLLELLTKSGKPISLNQLNSDKDLKLTMIEEHVSGINKDWLTKHADLFEVVPEPHTGEPCACLRQSYLSNEAGPEQELERSIEVVRNELEELRRRKQRAVVEEEYVKAGHIKRQEEAVTSELTLLTSMMRSTKGQSTGPHGDEPTGQENQQEDHQDKGKDKKKKKERPKVETFAQDVRDEELFPLLVPTGAKIGPSKRPVSAGPGVKVQGTHVSSTKQEARTLTSNKPDTVKDDDVLDLKESLIQFLKAREGNCAHINEVNNDKFLQKVMAAQRPEPVRAVNKAWLKKIEDTFVLLRTADNEMYIALHEDKQDKKVLRPASGAGEKQQKTPAYQQVIQCVRGANMPAVVYDYSKAAQKDSGSGLSSSSGLAAWRDKFLSALQSLPTKTCSIAALLDAVPTFGEAMGTTRPNEQQELLLMFLQASPDTFCVEKRGFGAQKEYLVRAK